MSDALNRMATVAAYAMSQCASNGCGPDYWYDSSRNYGTKSSYYGSTCKKSRNRQKVGHKKKSFAKIEIIIKLPKRQERNKEVSNMPTRNKKVYAIIYTDILKNKRNKRG